MRLIWRQILLLFLFKISVYLTGYKGRTSHSTVRILDNKIKILEINEG